MERQLSVLDEAGEFSTTAPFASSAELVSPSGLTLSSPQFKTACLGAYTKVSQVSERQNKSASGQKGTKSEWKRVGEYWNQVDDFRVRFAGRDIPLQLRDVSDHFQLDSETLTEPPSYVERKTIPYTSAYRVHYAVEESVFMPGEKVFVAAQVGPGGGLEPHPELKKLLVYPGSREDCLAHFSQESRVLRWVSYALVAFSLLSCLVIWAIFRKLESKNS